MMKKTVFLVSLLFLITSACAFEYNFTRIKDVAYPGESLIYNILFPEGQAEESLLLGCNYATILLNDSKEAAAQCSISPYWITLGETRKTARLTIPIPKNALNRTFNIVVDAWSRETQETSFINLPAKIILAYQYIDKTPEQINVKILSLSFPSKVDPRESFTVISYINNSERFIIPAKLKLSIFNEKTLYETTEEKELDGLRTTKFEKTINLNSDNSGEYLIELTVYYGNTILARTAKMVNIEAYSLVDKQEQVSSSLFGKEITVTLKNTGTGEETVEIKKDIGILEWFLTTEISGAPAFTGGAVVWTVKVPAGEEIKLHYKTTYVPLLLLPFIIIGFAWVVWWTDRKVDVKKGIDYKAEQQKVEGRVLISFKNITNKPIEDIELEEEVPAFITEVGEFGTAKPEIKKEGANSKLVWKIKTAFPKEERIYSYRFKTRVGVIGKVSLPPATLKFNWKKTPVERRSNVVSFVNEEK